ncbi:MAG: hypothetical protein LWW94_09350 [Candidatus Desulfofervidaceae bacterium]|nr:hypothetical protein [Candidatus Desulfofervidaceae bacterium]
MHTLAIASIRDIGDALIEATGDMILSKTAVPFLQEVWDLTCPTCLPLDKKSFWG